MAQVNVVANRGDKPKDYAISTGALALGNDAMALVYNRNANLTRGDVQKFVEEVEQFLTTHAFPAA